MRKRYIALLIFVLIFIIVFSSYNIFYKFVNMADKPLIPHMFQRYVYDDINFPVEKIKSRNEPSYDKFYKYFNVVNSLYLYITNFDLDSFLKDTHLKHVTFLQGYEKTKITHFSDSNIFGCVGKISDDTAIIAFRGTVSSIDWYEDFHYKQENLSNHIKDAKGRISTGFSGIYYNNEVISKKGCYCDSKCGSSIFTKKDWCYTDNNCGEKNSNGSWDYCDPENITSIKKQLEQYKNQHPEIKNYIITGHSLGSALATICAVDNVDKVKEVYLYAPPKIGNYKFAEYYNKKLGNKTYHFHTDGDAVPSMPLSAMSNTECYKHVALPHYVIDYKLEDPECKLTNIGLYHVSSAFISENALRQWKAQIQWSNKTL